MIRFTLCLVTLSLVACGGSDPSQAHGHSHEGPHGHSHPHEHEGDDHAHEGDDHAHEEVSLGVLALGDLEVQLAQGHGNVEAGKESHLVVKLPYSDGGATRVRAWIGTSDRTASLVGRADYAAGSDDYDVHATAPSPLAADAMWWVEIEKPDGTKLLGSKAPIR